MRWLACALCLIPCWAPLPCALAAVPADTELEAQGARIGTITIEGEAIFDESKPEESLALFKLANRLKRETRASAVRAQLLFASGDLYSGRVLRETERNLRALEFLHEPQITAIGWHDGIVDIAVRFRNVWSMSFWPRFGRSGGVNSSGIGFVDRDLLGRGKYIELGYARNVDRDGYFAHYRDPNLWGSRWQGSWSHQDASDGHAAALALRRPFYALDTRRSYVLEAGNSSFETNRYRAGVVFDVYRADQRRAEVALGWSAGLRGAHSGRWLAGWRLQRDHFERLPARANSTGTLAALPADRDFTYPFIGWSYLSDHFHTTRNQDQIDRTEDLHFGLSAALNLGWLAPHLGSDRHGALIDAYARYGWDFNQRHALFASVQLKTRAAGGRAVDRRETAQLAWYWRHSERWTTHARAALRTGARLDLDHYATLGGDSGLRGYPLRYRMGLGSALITFEQRLYTRKSILGLLDVGAAVFIDAGKMWGATPIDAPRSEWLGDAGLGLRLGNRRSALGNVVHIDVAAPLSRGPNVRGVQLLITTRESF